ncbi:hypothetical protein BV25DRAFT_1874571 [Artomyces pyxidatus]|uniref:Uncharacterized protein n=1 Tax=Artomyces pyxidatus TaxID=48021 RepID=A0ACB8TKY5_9AGAM|nr:hypothetical protein BV25DRAFT_1874571 [Artomyces pyxidatus]
MSTVIDVSNKLGEYLLQGWVLTDKTCSTEGCRRVPLMRSPDGTTPVTWFCPTCESTSGPLDSNSIAEPPSQPHAPSSLSMTSSTHYSRPSTPATEVSSTLSSPTFALPAETEESLRRRQQSDQASSEIGKRLLKGWAMLADECPSSSCYGIPLVRPPKAGGARDPRKECVVCGTVYIDQKDAQGFERLVPWASSSSQQHAANPSISSGVSGTTSVNKGKAVERDNTPMVAASALPPVQSPPTSNSLRPALALTSVSQYARPQDSNSKSTNTEPPPPKGALTNSVQALEATLNTLSRRMTSLSGQSILDPTMVGQTADAMSKVVQALQLIKNLMWSDSQASAMQNP